MSYRKLDLILSKIQLYSYFISQGLGNKLQDFRTKYISPKLKKAK